MQKFGYLDQSGPKSLISTKAMIDALKLVQKFGGLKETGILNSETFKVICFYPNILIFNQHHYTFFEFIWCSFLHYSEFIKY